jgi:hypothetical protein
MLLLLEEGALRLESRLLPAWWCLVQNADSMPMTV